MELANLRRDIELFNEKRTRVFVILQSATETLKPLLKKEDWPFEIVCDPTVIFLYSTSVIVLSSPFYNILFLYFVLILF